MSRASATAWQADGTTIGYTNNGKVPHVIDTESNRTTYIYDGHDPFVRSYSPGAARDASTK